MIIKKENILKLADRMEQLGDELDYDQEVFRHNCGSPACIFGWAADTFSEEYKEALEQARRNLHPLGKSVLQAPQWLPKVLRDAMGEHIFGIDKVQTELLVASTPINVEGYNIFGDSPKVEDAVAVLRHLAETGTVAWEIAPNAEEN